MIRPPPGPPPLSPRVTPNQIAVPGSASFGAPGVCFGVNGGSGAELVRPEGPAKYISEIPKLVQADLASSAVVCGNWLAQVRQVMGRIVT